MAAEKHKSKHFLNLHLMKKVTFCFAFIFLMLFAFQASAQFTFGIKAGVNLANMIDKDDSHTYSTDYKTKTGFHLGVTGEYAISDNFCIEPGLLFSTKGFRIEQDGIKFSANLNYLELPINAMYKIDLDPAKIFIMAGPYLAYAVSGKYKADQAVLGDNEDQKEQKINIGSDKESDDIKGFDFGLNFGAGVQFNAITFGLQYGLGLANLSPYTENGTMMKNKVIGISLGYKFVKK